MTYRTNAEAQLIVRAYRELAGSMALAHAPMSHDQVAVTQALLNETRGALEPQPYDTKISEALERVYQQPSLEQS